MKQRVKINEEMVALYIARHHKEISRKIQLLRGLTERGRIEKSIRHIKYIGWIYRRGNTHIRYLIENLFVRSFEGIRKRYLPEQWKLLYVEIS